MRAMLVVNPAATSTSPRARDVLVHALSADLKLEVAHTSHRGHAMEYGQRAASDGLDLVVVLGGDGTINEVVNGLLSEGPGADLPTLAVVPGGSTNVFSRALGISTDPVEATGELLEALQQGQSRRIGLGRANERWFTFTAGLGLDAGAVRLVEAARGKGANATPSRYAWSAVRRFFATDRRHPTMTLQRPGEDDLENLFLAIVSNTSPWTYFRSRPVVMNPTASFDAGLDLVTLTRMRTLGTVMAAGRMLTKGGIRGRSVLRFGDLSEFTVTASCPQPFQVDGDFLGERQSVTFRAIPGALRVIATDPTTEV